VREQTGYPYSQTGQGRPIQRQSLVPQHSASQHRVGHQAGLHPEEDYELEEDERYYSTRPPTSAVRYRTTAQDEDLIFKQGNKRFVVHPPKQRQLPPPPIPKQVNLKYKFHFHPLVWVGAALFIMIFGFIALNALGSWIQAKQDDLTYGQKRHFEIDAVVGHADTSSNPSHFIAENNNGNIYVIELPGGDSSKAKIYQITDIAGNEGNPPVKLSFQDINRDGKLDLIVQIGDPGNAVTIILFNNGSQFVSKL
jgi:hypothetical protein